MSASLTIRDLHASIPGREILRGVDLVVPAGEVHAIMGPNGSGKSTLAHVLLGRPGYEDVRGEVLVNGVEVLGLPTWQRAQAGLFLGMQHPIEVPGVRMADMLTAALEARGEHRSASDLRNDLEREADRIGLNVALLDRGLNTDLSGGEKKRNETVQLSVLSPAYAILDEVDSGLDVDALRAVSRRVLDQVAEHQMGVLVITHFQRLLAELTPDVVHVFVDGRIVRTGGPELALELEKTGYESYAPPTESVSGAGRAEMLDDPFADPFA